jgi:uncharacterized protein (TIGR00369 family)
VDGSHQTPPWREPVRGDYPPAATARLPGIEQLRALIAEGPMPPISHLAGMQLTDAGVATASFAMPATRWLLSPQGVISCGTLAILADGPLGCAVHSALPAATGYATSELSLRLLRPARAGGTLVARGRLVHAGPSLALSGVQIFDGDGRLLADGSSLCFVRSLRDPGGDAPAPPAAPATAMPAAESPDPYERPALGAVLEQAIWDRMSGLEILQAQIDGDLARPPIHYLTGLRPTEVRRGEAIFALPCHEWLCSPLRTIEGGAIAMLADSALVAAIQTTAPPGAAVAAIDLKVNFLRPASPDGRDLRAHGRVRHGGRTISIAEADVVNADGKTVAVATGSAMVLAGRAAALGPAD